MVEASKAVTQDGHGWVGVCMQGTPVALVTSSVEHTVAIKYLAPDTHDRHTDTVVMSSDRRQVAHHQQWRLAGLGMTHEGNHAIGAIIADHPRKPADSPSRTCMAGSST